MAYTAQIGTRYGTVRTIYTALPGVCLVLKKTVHSTAAIMPQDFSRRNVTTVKREKIIFGLRPRKKNAMTFFYLSKFQKNSKCPMNDYRTYI
jgi:hypothetical protein